MKVNSGYDILLAGHPSDEVCLMPEPEVLHIPLWSRRFTFTQIEVRDGERVRQGQVVARDPGSHAVPLPAPREGTVRIGVHDKHLTLEDIKREKEEPFEPEQVEKDVPENVSSGGMERYKLLELGAWQFFEDVQSGALPDPFETPDAIIVNTLHFEPYEARADVQAESRLDNMLYGLECLCSIFDGTTVYVAVEEDNAEVDRTLAEGIGRIEAVQCLETPVKYPQDNPALLARRAGLNTGAARVWSTDVAGLLAIHRAEKLSLPATIKVVSLAGPAVNQPGHLKVFTGYPLDLILDERLDGERNEYRIINGGVLTGDSLDEDMVGLPAECSGLTVLEEQTKRKFLAFMRPGADRRSYSRTFLSSLRGSFTEHLDTSTGGEQRPCVCCGYCERVCPAGIMPHLIHRHLYGDDIEEAERLRLDLCVGCGLCSYVCPSKIDLREQITSTQQELRSEHEMAEA